MSMNPASTTTSSQVNPSAFTLRPATLSDLTSIAQVWSRAFFDDEIIGHMMHPFRGKYPDDIYWFLLRGIRERYFIWRHQFIVVTATEDGTSRVVGAADWRRLGHGGKRMELAWWDPRNVISPLFHTYHNISLYFFPNRAADPSRASFLDTAVANSEKNWTGERAECWDLHVCGVEPEFQGKGVGKLLATWGVKEAEKEGQVVCASVLCGEKNRGFYGKAGLVTQVGGSGEGIALFTR